MTPDETEVPQVCPHCGSIHFQAAHVAQYSFSTGHPYQLITDHIEVVMCLCGHMIPVKRLDSPDADHRALQASIHQARQYHERTDGRSRADVARDFITQTEFQALSQKLTTLEITLEQMGKKNKKTNKTSEMTLRKRPA
jgi:hypothetical protein